MIRFAVLGQTGQTGESHDAETEQDGPKYYKHIVGYAVDNILEA